MTRTPTLFDPNATDGVVTGFLAGARAAFAGIPTVFSDGRLRLLAVLPMTVHVALFSALLFWLVGTVAPDAAAALNHALGAEAGSGGAWTKFLAGVVHGAVIVLGVVVAFFGSILASNVVCDPFYDALSERTEELFLDHDVGNPFSVWSMAVGVVRELQANLIRLAVWGIVAVPLWLLSFTFLGLVTGPLSLLWAWLFSAYEFFSRSLGRHTVDMPSRFRTLFSHKSFFLGFGATAALLSLLPFTSPFLVVGATRSYLALAARGRVASQLTSDDKARLVAIIEKKAIST